MMSPGGGGTTGCYGEAGRAVLADQHETGLDVRAVTARYGVGDGVLAGSAHGHEGRVLSGRARMAPTAVLALAMVVFSGDELLRAAAAVGRIPDSGLRRRRLATEPGLVPTRGEGGWFDAAVLRVRHQALEPPRHVRDRVESSP